MTAERGVRWRAIRVAAAIVVVDIGVWLVYQCVLGGPSAGFYPMVGVCFLVVPVLGAAVAARRPGTRRGRTFAAVAGGVVVVQVFSFVLGYAFVPYFAAVTTVDPPASCDGSYTGTDRRIRVGEKTMILLIQEKDVLVAAEVDAATRASTVHLVRTPDLAVLYSVSYPDDNVAVAMSGTTVFLFNEALGTMVDRATGAPVRERMVVSIDSYGRNVPDSFENTGMFGWRGTFETSGYFSIWWRDGSVELLQELTFSGLQDGCYIDGQTNTVRKL